MASDRLCELGYDEAQVEEALEMFQNCESKVIPACHSLHTKSNTTVTPYN